ncbi:hypothetical protein GLAREA_01056 [Glarea lozoyensis ATCC 20868]|uniref:Uncharacterized protein n=1 Tax=Glarea lozoyensis (strain ATCC 20868 / MF5171) TaxID=1116229 RepID=S3DD30_GLAL2|nr:uncharacterized protein GLAREA_01056 [Glarea lozoyensis ATCC 20868]EPE29896.1 hypothetical protein GLAREA_01056 [Glarea lozoyensis ATCC 20868]
MRPSPLTNTHFHISRDCGGKRTSCEATTASLQSQIKGEYAQKEILRGYAPTVGQLHGGRLFTSALLKIAEESEQPLSQGLHLYDRRLKENILRRKFFEAVLRRSVGLTNVNLSPLHFSRL